VEVRLERFSAAILVKEFFNSECPLP